MKLNGSELLKGIVIGVVVMWLVAWVYPELIPSKVAGGGESHTTTASTNTDTSADEGAGSGGQGVTLAKIRKQGYVKVGFANEAPYAYRDSDTGRLTGESPEIARVILKRLGVDKIKGVLVDFGALIPGLKAGRFDVIAAGMYITPSRCKQINFSNPTYGIADAFAVRTGNPKKLHGYKDVITNHATLGVVTGAVERGYAQKVGIPNSQIKVFPDAPSALEAVAGGRVDAYGGTSLTVRDLLKKANSDKLEVASPFKGPIINGEWVKGYGAYGFRRDETALLDAFNRQLKQFVPSKQHLKLVKPFGFTKAELPGDVTAAGLCKG